VFYPTSAKKLKMWYVEKFSVSGGFALQTLDQGQRSVERRLYP